MQKDKRIEISNYLIPSLFILIIILASFFFWGKDEPRIENRNSDTPNEERYNELPTPSPCLQVQEDGSVIEVECKG